MKIFWAGVCSLIYASSALAAPIFEYKFNSTGTTSPSTGTDSTPVEFTNSGGAIDLHSSPGLGVAGDIVGHPDFGTDRAFNNTASTGMGNATGATGGMAAHATDVASVDTLSSFTLSGWFKTDTTAGLNGFARLIYNRTSNNGFHLIAGDVAGELRPAVDGTEVNPDVTPGYDATQTWVFFAMTYDGTLASNNALFYRGYRNDAEAALFGDTSALTLIETRTINQGTVNDESLPLSIGNQATWNRPFDGYLDNIRIDGTQTGAGGVLSAVDLEARRLGDITPIPEPSTWLALAGLLSGGWYLRRKKA